MNAENRRTQRGQRFGATLSPDERGLLVCPGGGRARVRRFPGNRGDDYKCRVQLVETLQEIDLFKPFGGVDQRLLVQPGMPPEPGAWHFTWTLDKKLPIGNYDLTTYTNLGATDYGWSYRGQQSKCGFVSDPLYCSIPGFATETDAEHFLEDNGFTARRRHHDVDNAICLGLRRYGVVQGSDGESEYARLKCHAGVSTGHYWQVWLTVPRSNDDADSQDYGPVFRVIRTQFLF
jgi:hypothetical protein